MQMSFGLQRSQDQLPSDNSVKKRPPAFIIPASHTGFSSTIIHFLSAVRKAMISPLEKDDLCTNVGLDMVKEQVPSLTVRDIANRVKLNPINPSVLETQVPLEALVRGALKIFFSKTVSMGVKDGKELLSYEKSNKTWTWVGPANIPTSDNDGTSPDAWGIPDAMLVKLVDTFANWLERELDIVRQIASLPAPPASLFCFPDEEERFKNFSDRRSNTISPSSDEVRTYFRKEEALRYSIPKRAFSYTTVDGKKSFVAPVRKELRDKSRLLLKRGCPSQVTMLCLFRDAAARLPGSIGTKADICTLLRDSQYIVEDVSNSELAKFAKWRLRVLKDEQNPCIEFNADRRVWVYLHKNWEEEDFEVDIEDNVHCTSSLTNQGKRQTRKKAEEGVIIGGSCLVSDASSDMETDGLSNESICSNQTVEEVDEKEKIVCKFIAPVNKSSAGGQTFTTRLIASRPFRYGACVGFSKRGVLVSRVSGALVSRLRSTYDDKDVGKEVDKKGNAGCEHITAVAVGKSSASVNAGYSDDEDAGKERLFGELLS